MKDLGGKEIKQISEHAVDNPGCFNRTCKEKNRSGGIWYMGLDASGQGHFACRYDAPFLFNVFKVRVAKRKRK